MEKTMQESCQLCMNDCDDCKWRGPCCLCGNFLKEKQKDSSRKSVCDKCFNRRKSHLTSKGYNGIGDQLIRDGLTYREYALAYKKLVK